MTTTHFTNTKRSEARDVPAGLDEIVRRIVEIAAPDRIVLFGSAARGTAGPNSDFDLLVIKPGSYHRGQLTEAIYRGLIGVDHAVDVVVATPEDVNRFQETPALIFAAALREGRTLYAA